MAKTAFLEDFGKDDAEYSAAHHAELAAKVGEDVVKYSVEHSEELAKEGEVIGAEQAAKFQTEHAAELKPGAKMKPMKKSPRRPTKSVSGS